MIQTYFHLLYISAVVVSIELGHEVYQAVVTEHRKVCWDLWMMNQCANPVDIVVIDPSVKVNTSAGNETEAGVFGVGCCSFCNCYEDCIRYGSCCPEVYGSLEEGKNIVDSSRFVCASPRYITDSNKTNYVTAFGLKDVWMIGKCNPDITMYVDERIAALCLSPGSDKSIHSLVPVSDGVLHYRNKYCAFCNGREHSILTNWKLEIACTSLISLDEVDILDKVEKKKCNLFYRPPAAVPTVRCEIPKYSISTCNETGLWQVYNETMELACDAFVDPFNLTYKNYFCFLCNRGDVLNSSEMYCKVTQDITDVSPPFTSLLDLGGIEAEMSTDLPKCDVLSEFRDYKKMICRRIICGDDRYLSGLQCHLKLNPTAKCYQIFVKLVPSQIQKYTNYEYLKAIASSLIYQSIASNATSVRDFRVYTKTTTDGDSQYIDYVIVEVSASVRSTQQADVEAELVEKLHGKSFGVFISELARYEKTIDSETKIHVFHQTSSGVDILSPGFSRTIEDGKSGEYKCSETTTVSFSKIKMCPYLQIGIDEWHISFENDILSVEKEFTTKTFQKWEYEVNGSLINLCLQDFQSVYKSLPSSVNSGTRSDGVVGPKQILAFVCVILSLVSLVVTIFVYFMFSELQSQPGINNVVLCICLLLAQSLYQFGAGQRSLSYWGCSVVGAFCHLFWLSVMFSMNSCAVQMYLIFRSSMKLTPKFRMKHTLKYVIYIFVASFVFVIINVIVSVIKSGGNESGYGGNVCYISSYYMHLITFILPTACIVLTNLGLFAYVVFKIKKSNVSSTKMNVDRNYFGVYARLSTLTGLTWILGFVMLFLKTDVIEYLFILFNASQGVLIMTAFVLNQRVFALFRKKKYISTLSSLIYSSQKRRSNTGWNSKKMSDAESECKPSTSYDHINGKI